MAHADPASELATKPLGRLLLRFAIPSIFAQIVNLLYNIVDRIFVGRIPEIGPLALAGLGVAFPIILIISSFSFLAGMGGAPPMPARKEKDEMIRMMGKATPSPASASGPISGILPTKMRSTML